MFGEVGDMLYGGVTREFDSEPILWDRLCTQPNSERRQSAARSKRTLPQ